MISILTRRSGRHGALPKMAVIAVSLMLMQAPTPTQSMLTLKKLLEAKILGHALSDHHKEPQFVAIPVPVGPPPPPPPPPIPVLPPPLPVPPPPPPPVIAPVPVAIPIHHIHYAPRENKFFDSAEISSAQLAALARKYHFLNQHLSPEIHDDFHHHHHPHHDDDNHHDHSIHPILLTNLVEIRKTIQKIPESDLKNLTLSDAERIIRNIQMQQMSNLMMSKDQSTDLAFGNVQPIKVLSEMSTIEHEKEDIKEGARVGVPAYLGKLPADAPKKKLNPQQLREYMEKYAIELQRQQAMAKAMMNAQSKAKNNLGQTMQVMPPPQRPLFQSSFVHGDTQELLKNPQIRFLSQAKLQKGPLFAQQNQLSKQNQQTEQNFLALSGMQQNLQQRLAAMRQQEQQRQRYNALQMQHQLQKQQEMQQQQQFQLQQQEQQHQTHQAQAVSQANFQRPQQAHNQNTQHQFEVLKQYEPLRIPQGSQQQGRPVVKQHFVVGQADYLNYMAPAKVSPPATISPSNAHQNFQQVQQAPTVYQQTPRTATSSVQGGYSQRDVTQGYHQPDQLRYQV